MDADLRDGLNINPCPLCRFQSVATVNQPSLGDVTILV